MTKNPRFKVGDKVREKCNLTYVLTVVSVSHEQTFWKYKIVDLQYKQRWVMESQIIALEPKHDKQR